MRRQLTLVVGATCTLILIAFLVPLAVLVRNAAAERAVNAGVVSAQALGPSVSTLGEAELNALLISAPRPTTVFLPNGHVLGTPAPLSAAVETARSGQSFTTSVAGGREILIAVGGLDDGTAVIRTLVPDSELTAGVARSWLILGLLGLVLLGVALLVAQRLARALTRSLSDTAAAAHRLANGELDARAAVAGPEEVREVGAGLNLLAGRIVELLDQERAAAADLSHRLRTPLTALRIDAESLHDEAERARLVSGLDALERRVDDAIRDAARPVREGVRAASDAAAVVADRTRFWSVLAEDQGRLLSVSVAPGPVPVRVSAEDLAACVDALIGNVFAHTPEGTDLRVRLDPRRAGGAYLVVADDGPGLADPSALERGVSGAGSTGLGLDIVSRTANRAGGRVEIGRSSTGGAEITVHLGPPVATVAG